MNYLYFIILGLLPSIIWLLFYLRKDKHPEPKTMVIKVFIYGMAASLPAVFLEIGSADILKSITIPHILFLALYFLLGVALVEEILKYLVVRFWVLKSPEFDEPIDAMIYMIISALGFAAIENILVLFPLSSPNIFEKTLLILSARFAGATFLHALASANIGFFLALSLLREKHHLRYLTIGLTLSVFLHGLYNFGIKIEGMAGIIVPFLVLLFLFLIVKGQFKKIKKLSSVCNLE
jgi:RsiW-degrading membrane proteinase PrsW (M82 family)